MRNYTSKFRRSISADKRQSVQGHSSITQPLMFATRTGMRILIDDFQQAKLDSSLQNLDGSTSQLRNITFGSQQRDEHTTWLKSKLRHHIVKCRLLVKDARGPWNTLKSTYSKSSKSGSGEPLPCFLAGFLERSSTCKTGDKKHLCRVPRKLLENWRVDAFVFPSFTGR